MLFDTILCICVLVGETLSFLNVGAKGVSLPPKRLVEGVARRERGMMTLSVRQEHGGREAVWNEKGGWSEELSEGREGMGWELLAFLGWGGWCGLEVLGRCARGLSALAGRSRTHRFTPGAWKRAGLAIPQTLNYRLPLS